MTLVESLVGPLTLVAAVGCGVLGGVFFAFSNFVMAALARVQPGAGLAAMQSINVAVLNPLFFVLFFGASALSLLLGVYGIVRMQHDGAVWFVIGAAAQVLGSFLVTVIGNVPLNEALAKHDAASGDSAPHWRQYIQKWTAWNHVRTAASVLACAAFIIGVSER